MSRSTEENCTVYSLVKEKRGGRNVPSLYLSVFFILRRREILRLTLPKISLGSPKIQSNRLFLTDRIIITRLKVIDRPVNHTRWYA